MAQGIECDNCKAHGSLKGTYVQWADGTKRLKTDVRSYYSISKHRYDHATAPFETLHFCTLDCLVRHVLKLAANV